MRNKKLSFIVALSLILSLCLIGCSKNAGYYGYDIPLNHTYETDDIPSIGVTIESPSDNSVDIEVPSYIPPTISSIDTPSINETVPSNEPSQIVTTTDEFISTVLFNIPWYSGNPYAIVNNNMPFFEDDEINTTVFETYSNFDNLGRCGVAYANICKELMPTDSRESISSVTPTGWKYNGKSNNNTYDWVDAKYIYNRCHLIGFQLAGENANDKNLVTGTRYLNVTGMLPFENMIDDYVDETNNHVLYRVTPIFTGNNLVCDGVLMEGYSVEDDGDGICFNIFCYNVEPGCGINYATGENWSTGDLNTIESANTSFSITGDTKSQSYGSTSRGDTYSDLPNGNGNSNNSNGNSNNTTSTSSTTYILNTNSKKFHLTSCSYGQSTSEKNKKEYIGNRDTLIADGYTPCGSCNP